MIIETHGKVERRPPVQLADRRPRKAWVSFLAWMYLAGIAGLWLAMREYGDRSWIGALLLLGPRWVYATPLVVLVPLALLLRQWRSTGILISAAGLLLFPVMGFRVDLGGSGVHDFRLLSLNIHRQHLDPQRLKSFLDETRPDIVALQGWSDMHREDLFPDASWTVIREGELLLASSFPAKLVETLNLKQTKEVSYGEQGAAALFSIQTPKGPINLINLHLASPHAGLDSMWKDKGTRLEENVERRRREAEQVKTLGDRSQGTLLLCGDFNSTSESPLFREVWDGFSDAFLERGTGLGYTYLNTHTQIRIDHILGDASCGFTKCWVGPDVNAAHRPLVADVMLR